MSVAVDRLGPSLPLEERSLLPAAKHIKQGW